MVPLHCRMYAVKHTRGCLVVDNIGRFRARCSVLRPMDCTITACVVMHADHSYCVLENSAPTVSNTRQESGSGIQQYSWI